MESKTANPGSRAGVFSFSGVLNIFFVEFQTSAKQPRPGSLPGLVFN
jgi:hypothetical protein